MAMTEEEIASAAARRSAARRKRVSKRCELCGTEFEGLTTKRYCSDRCRVEAARLRARRRPEDLHKLPKSEGPPFDVVLTEEELEPRPGEDAADYFTRIRQAVFGDFVFDTDSVELVRQSRIERTNELMRALGWDDLVEER